MAEKDRWRTENMKRNGEFGMSSSEIPNPNASYLNLSHRHHHHHQLVNGSPMSRVSRQPESCPSSSFSNGLGSSEDGWVFPIPLEEVNQTPGTHYSNINGRLVDDMDLSETMHRMHIGDEQREGTKMRGFEVGPDGFGFGDGYFGGTIPWSGEHEGYSNGASGYEGFQSSHHETPASFNDDVGMTLLGLEGGYRGSDSMGSYLDHNQSNAFYSGPSCSKNHMNFLLEKRNERGNGCYYRGVQLQNPATSRPYLNDTSICSPWGERDSNGVRGLREPLNVDHSLCSRLILNEGTRAIPNSMVPPSVLSRKGATDVEAFTCEDGFIIHGNSLNYGIDKKCNASRSHKKNYWEEIAEQNQRRKSSELDGCFIFGRSCENGPSQRSDSPLFLPLTFTSLAEVQGYIYFIAKDQYGCRLLQKVFDEGTCQDVQIIFNEIVSHVGELATDTFGNYLVQKLLDVCSEEQRLQIVLIMTNKPGQLIRISLNTHGTRVVQKLIETVKTRKQISLVKSALERGFLDLIKDVNGYHVIQRSLQYLSNEDNTFILVAAAKYCVDIATHRHGCCVLQRCISHSTGEHRDKLVTEITRNGLLLAQDPFGNYVVQYIIEMKIPAASAKLMSQFKGNYVQLSMQKFSSHVVEKCLKHFEESRSRIIRELLSVSHFEQLLQDPFGNYVIQSALAVTKGPLHASLVEEVRRHNVLRTSPYCKRIFSRKLMKD